MKTNIDKLKCVLFAIATLFPLCSYGQAVNYYFKGMTREDDGKSWLEFLDASEVDSITFVTERETVFEKADEVDGHKSYKYGVDLGLESGIRWSSMNLGASKPEELGDYYVSGVVDKEDDSFFTTEWNGESPVLYFTELLSEDGSSLDDISGTKYDAARHSWGGKWRMPTTKETFELFFECEREIVDNGLKLTGPNGNSIIVSGFWTSCLLYGIDQAPDGTMCKGPSYGEAFYWMNNEYTVCPLFRMEGMQIRPVYDYEEGMSTGVTYNDVDYVIIHKSDGTKVKVKQSYLMQMHFMGSHACEMDEEPVVPYSVAVDLGLKSGNLWAPFNVGASYPSESGDYFAVGETSPKPIEEYNMAHWRFAYDAAETCPYLYATTDGHDYHSLYGAICTFNDPSMDPAHVNWGGRWKMGDLQELQSECTFEWMSQNGVNGYKVTGPNGNHIFLPAAGIAYGDAEQIGSVSHWNADRTMVLTGSHFQVGGTPGGAVESYNSVGFYLTAGASFPRASGGIWTGYRYFTKDNPKPGIWPGDGMELGRTVRAVIAPR